MKSRRGPSIRGAGLVEDDAVFDEVRPLIEDALRQALSEGYDDPYQLQQVVRRTTGRWVNQAPSASPDDHPRRPRGLTLRHA